MKSLRNYTIQPIANAPADFFVISQIRGGHNDI